MSPTCQQQQQQQGGALLKVRLMPLKSTEP